MAKYTETNCLAILTDGETFVDDQFFKFGETGVHDSALAEFITDIVKILFKISKFNLLVALLDNVVAEKSVYLLLAYPGAGA